MHVASLAASLTQRSVAKEKSVDFMCRGAPMKAQKAKEVGWILLKTHEGVSQLRNEIGNPKLGGHFYL